MGGRATGRPSLTNMPIPHDLIDELDRELSRISRTLVDESDRLTRLIELNRLALGVSLRLGRPVSVVELFDELGEAPEERLAALVRSLREIEGPSP